MTKTRWLAVRDGRLWLSEARSVPFDSGAWVRDDDGDVVTELTDRQICARVVEVAS